VDASSVHVDVRRPVALAVCEALSWRGAGGGIGIRDQENRSSMAANEF
jgi:hypothetical protein